MGRKRKDITGEKFGYLTAICFDHYDGKNTYWRFRCKCGNDVVRSLKKINEAKTPSCGCYQKERIEIAKREREEKNKYWQENGKYYHKDAKCNKNLTGEIIGDLEILKMISEKSGKETQYICKCHCGKIVVKNQRYLISNSSNKNCGCKRKNATPYSDFSKKRLHSIYRNMIDRCYNPKNNNYKNYGGKGITVTSSWLGENGFWNFYKWAMNNGYKDNLTIDRINVYGNYKPSNCRWADVETQANNKTTNIYIEYNGEILSMAMFCRKHKVDYDKTRELINKDCMFSGNYILEKLKL